MQLHSSQSKLYTNNPLLVTLSLLIKFWKFINELRLSWSGSLVMKHTLVKWLVTDFESENCYLDHCYESTDHFHDRTSAVIHSFINICWSPGMILTNWGYYPEEDAESVLMISQRKYCDWDCRELPNLDLMSGRWFGEEVFQREKDVPGLEPKEYGTFWLLKVVHSVRLTACEVQRCSSCLQGMLM